MRISFRHRYVMFDIPKSASTSINFALRRVSECILDGNGGLKHTHVTDYETYLEPLLQKRVGVQVSDFERIAVVREPLDMLKSYYTYLQRPGVENPRHVDHSRSTVGLSFGEFVRRVLDEQGGKVKPIYSVSRPSGFVKDLTGKVGIDSLFSYDNLDGFSDYMSEKTGETIELEARNVSKVQVQFDITTSLLGEMREILAEDFELYEAIAAKGDAGPLKIRGSIP